MNDFKSFMGDKKSPEQGVSGKALPPEWEKEVKKAASALENKGEEDVLREIYARAEAAKRAGTLSNAEIDAFLTQISPMLDEKQRKKLAKLAAHLKRI